MIKKLTSPPLSPPLYIFPFFLTLFLGLLVPNPCQSANKTAATMGGSYEVVPDGYFENPALSSSPGYAYRPSGSSWTFIGSSGYSRNNTGFTSGNPSAPQGNQVLFLQGTGRVTQTMALTNGFYRFKLKAAQRGNHQASSQTIQLRVDGQAVHSFVPSGTNYQEMATANIYLTSGNHVIELRGLNPNGGDNTAFADQFMVLRLKDIPLSGFESPVLPVSPGFAYGPSGGPWTFTSGGGISRNGTGFTSGNPVAPEGNQVAFLQGGGSATISVNAPKAGFYRFRFKAARRGNHPSGGATKQVRITVANKEVGEFKVPSTNYTEMISLAVYLGAGNHNLTLTGVNPIAGDHTAFVDDLRMEPLYDWQDPFVWGGSVPNANDMATVGALSNVVMRGSINANRIVVNGNLLAAQNQHLDITAKNIMIMGGSALFEIGQDLAPYPAEATITLNASPSDPDIGAMGNKFLGAMNGATIHMHGAEQKSWTQLGANAAANAGQITLKEAVSWSAGDEFVLVSSRKNWNEAEKRTIASVTGGGTILNFTDPLDYPHAGVVKSYSDGSRNWTADLRAEVGCLSRNIKVQGDATSTADGFGGHIMVMANSKAYVGGVELYNMGQKAELGRYPFHWHMLGDVGEGQYLKNSAIHQSYNRAVTIHGTESTLVENNFCYDHIGHGIFLEDGSERFNVIRKNVVLLSKRPAPGEEVTPSDNQFNQVQNRTPSSYWITNPQNTFEDNVAAGTHGTGYWFAFPTKPMGPSATDPRFSNLKPHQLPLISFNRNSAHSCMSGFDIFDQLNPDHSIKTNWGWDNSSNHFLDNCLWYANDLAVYSGIGAGGPVENVIWRNNVFVENKVGTMLASYSKVDGAAFVANSGESLLSGQRHAYRVYDGAGQVLNSHFFGWDASNANLLMNTGAATKHPNHILNGNTTDHSGLVRISLPEFDIAPTQAHANHPAHPRYWSIVLRDIDGGLTGKANTSLVCNHPFVLTGGEYQAPNWTRAYRSDHRFVLSKLTYNLNRLQHPNLVCTRTKSGTATEHVYYVDGYKEHHQLPFIVNEGYEYTYTYESLPSSKRVNMYMDDASTGDNYVARFKDFGKLGGLSMNSDQGSFPSRSSLTNLLNSSSSGYYRQPNGDLWIKAVATGKIQRFEIAWTSNFSVPTLDTDGDQMSDANEIAANRHPFTATDLAARFSTAGDFEGWTGIANVSGANVANGVLSGTSVNNGDAIIANNEFNFKSGEVPYLKVRLKASQNTAAQIFFGTNSAPGYSGSRVVTAGYTGNGNWQTLTFNMSGHSAWNGTITDLRLDPVSGVNINFEIDWIEASATAKTSAEASVSEPTSTGFAAFPNPFGDQLDIRIGNGEVYERIQLIDLQGRILKEETLDDSIQKLKWSFADQPLSKGVYLLQLIGSQGSKRIKVIRY